MRTELKLGRVYRVPSGKQKTTVPLQARVKAA
jgi:hypothetical protein